jgi:hypothetical protein
LARDSFLLRIDPKILDAVRRWAEDEFRSVNGQIEYLLRQSLRDANRLEKSSSVPDSSATTSAPSSAPSTETAADQSTESAPNEPGAD